MMNMFTAAGDFARRILKPVTDAGLPAALTSWLARPADAAERKRRLRQRAAMALLIPTTVLATPYVWTEVVLPASSGASCGDGSPYKFFYNQNPLSANTVVFFEGGGACWTQSACVGGSPLAASNPNGVSDNYMYGGAGLLGGNIDPLISRVDLLGTSATTQGWTQVFLPYCTGDVHTGNKVAVYSDANPASPRTEYHRGYVNAQAVANWLAQNGFAKPHQLLVSGFSAGGTGATADYAVVRSTLQPSISALLDDSGMLFPAPRGGSVSQYPSLSLQNTIRAAWGLDLPNGLLTNMASRYPGQVDVNNLGAVPLTLARVFPNDRIGIATFQQDGIYSAFSYTAFNPAIAAATGSTQDAMLNKLWRQDLANFTSFNGGAPVNLGWYIPYGRPLIKSHCLTVLTFDDTGIADLNKSSVNDFVNDLTNANPWQWSWSTFSWQYVPVQRSVQSTQAYPADTLLMGIIQLAEKLFAPGQLPFGLG